MSKYAKLWDLIKRANPEQKKEILAKLSDEDLIQLRACANPYNKPIYKSGNRLLSFSFMNMEHEYMRDFFMTTMVGFIYKMAAEYDFSNTSFTNAPDLKKYVSEDDPEFASKLNEKYKQVAIDNLENHYGDVYEKTKKPEDCARMMRAVCIAAQKRGQNAETLEHETREYCKKYKIDYDAVFPTEVTVSVESLDKAKAELKAELGIKLTLQDKIVKIQDRILDFLDHYFKYDPNNHIRAGYSPNYDKILQERIKHNPDKFKYTENGMIVTDKFEHYLIPPADTHHSFRNYQDTNYEALRQCTDDIYGRKCTFETAILPLEVFSSEEKAEEFEKKYCAELDCSVHRVDFNSWTFLDSWRENRDKTIFNDDKAALIKEIIKQRQEDEKMGKELLKKKGRNMKGRVDSSKLPFASEVQNPALGVTDIETELKEYHDKDDLEIKVYQTKLLRSLRPRQQLNQASYGIKAENNK